MVNAMTSGYFGPLSVTLLLLMGCGPDETISGYADPEATYILQEVNGAPFPATASIQFPQEGQITGQGPCNTYSATQSAPYPWFDIGPILATRRACPALADEARFFETLSNMTLAEALGTTLILSNDAGTQMVFQSP